jgi:protein gp37
MQIASQRNGISIFLYQFFLKSFQWIIFVTMEEQEQKSFIWNLWHGCHKFSEGCRHCYVYRGDSKRGLDSTLVYKTKNFDLPVRKKRDGEYKIPSGSMVYTCFTSDFFVEDADPWRGEAWEFMRQRCDLDFLIITKRIERFDQCLPADWGEGYENVTICCTVENQECANIRLPVYMKAPIKHKRIICEPLLGPVDLAYYEIGKWAEQVVVGGESGNEARACDYSWVLQLRDECLRSGVPFWFKQTGTRFIKDGRLYKIARHLQHSQARKAGIDS